MYPHLAVDSLGFYIVAGYEGIDICICNSGVQLAYALGGFGKAQREIRAYAAVDSRSRISFEPHRLLALGKDVGAYIIGMLCQLICSKTSDAQNKG